MRQAPNPYLRQIRRTLPRLLALYDADETSESYGVGDRFFWAWGLIDFANGTFQGGANGLARLWHRGLWPYATTRDSFLRRLDAIFRGARFATQPDGSLQEAFPREGSFCVTALAAFDLLQALDIMAAAGLPEEKQLQWQAIVEPMICYLQDANETHAFISNHLATAVAALTRWHARTDNSTAERRARSLLDRVLDHQSSEGWFEEYGGTDPGYETLCLHYLSDVRQLRPDWNLLEPMRRSIGFLWHFAHPDGSFGGVYGSRCTRLYYPSGILALSRDVPEAAALSAWMAASIQRHKVVTLDSMDEPNLVPMFNSYCEAAVWLNENPAATADPPPIPAADRKPARIHFPQAGFLIDRGERHYTIVSTHKGGVVSHFPFDGEAYRDAGKVARNPAGRLGSTQNLDPENSFAVEGDRVTVETDFRQMPKRLPGVLDFLILRVLCLTSFRVPAIREWSKRRLARWLITSARKWPASNRRTIRLGADLHISDEPSLPDGYEIVEETRDFVPIHMASQGYWQIQDEERRA